MASALSKSIVVELFCYYRQAERSVHYALACPTQWSMFLAYYDQSKQAPIAELITLLKRCGATSNQLMMRKARSHHWLISVIAALIQYGRNKVKQSWIFSTEDLTFFSATLERLLQIVNTPHLPNHQELLDVRLDCYECQLIIERKLIGVRELRTAASIEHFNQSDYTPHVSFQDMGIHNL